MRDFLKAVPIFDHVYWVGAIDWDERDFHGYRIERGTTYNAFLIVDEKVTLIDTVKAPFYEELMARIRSVIDPARIDYIVSNHSEPDHTGCLRQVVAAVKPEKIFASPMGEKNLKAHFGSDLDITVVKSGEAVELGANKLHFVETRMLHWPDSMFTYLDGAKILFSQDAFGMHLAGNKLYTDEYPDYIIAHEARKYFANILLHLAPRIRELIEKLPSLGLDIGMIAPDHGPLWRKDINHIIELYHRLSLQEPTERALIIYSTMWGSTKKLAKSIIDGLTSLGISAESMLVPENERSAVITKLMGAGLVVFGTPTINNQMFPAMADILCYIRGLRPQNHIGGVFGSFGWSGEGPKLIQDELAAQGFEMPIAPFSVKFVPTEEDLAKAYDFGVVLGRELLEKTRNRRS